MARKLLAVASVLILTTGLIAGAATAGPGANSPESRMQGTLRAVERKDLPFAPKQIATEKVVEERVTTPRMTAPTGKRGKLDARLADKLNGAAASAEFEVLVTTDGDAADLVMSVGPNRVNQMFGSVLNGFAARLTAEQIRQLQVKSDVLTIGLNEVVRATEDTAAYWTGARKAKEDFALTGDVDGWRHGYSENDVVIAVIDTGIDTGHQDLADKVIGWADMINGVSEPYDDNGHGTHVASIATGAGLVNPLMQGVAPGAALVGVKVLDAEGSGTFASVIAGVDWAVEHKDEYNIKVIKTIQS